MKKKAFVEEFKTMGTAPFGLESNKTQKVMDWFAQADREIEKSNTYGRKFGTSHWNEKLANLQKNAGFLDVGKKVMGATGRMMAEPMRRAYSATGHGQMSNQLRTESYFHARDKIPTSGMEKVTDAYHASKRGLRAAGNAADKIRLRPKKNERIAMKAMGLGKRASSKKHVFNVRKERTKTEPKSTIYMDSERHLATHEKLANLRRFLNEG